MLPLAGLWRWKQEVQHMKSSQRIDYILSVSLDPAFTKSRTPTALNEHLCTMVSASLADSDLLRCLVQSIVEKILEAGVSSSPLLLSLTADFMTIRLIRSEPQQT